jgi:hypothetical protein
MTSIRNKEFLRNSIIEIPNQVRNDYFMDPDAEHRGIQFIQLLTCFRSRAAEAGLK